jgi:hypothetical protein
MAQDTALPVADGVATQPSTRILLEGSNQEQQSATSIKKEQTLSHEWSHKMGIMNAVNVNHQSRDMRAIPESWIPGITHDGGNPLITNDDGQSIADLPLPKQDAGQDS